MNGLKYVNFGRIRFLIIIGSFNIDQMETLRSTERVRTTRGQGISFVLKMNISFLQSIFEILPNISNQIFYAQQLNVRVCQF